MGLCNFKEKPFRSKKYRDYVRAMNCCNCGYPGTIGCIDVHHIETGGMSTKCGDNLVVPLCNMNGRGCHQKADKSPESAEKYRPMANQLFVNWKGKKP